MEIGFGYNVLADSDIEDIAPLKDLEKLEEWKCKLVTQRERKHNRMSKMSRKIICILCGLFIIANTMYVEGSGEVYPEDMITGNYCGMDEFEELNYYLFCNTQLHEDAGGFTYKPALIDSETQTIEEAKELYQSFMERLPIDYAEEREGEIIYVSYVSPDCKWVITNKWNEFRTIKTQTLFCEKEKVREKVNEIRVENNPVLIVKDGDSYREIDEEHYERLLELKKESYVHEGYSSIWKINAKGNLLAGIRDEYSLLTIREIEEGAEKWSFSLQGIQEEVAHIRDDVQEGNTVFVSIQQFEGDEKEGWLTVQAGQSSFFRIAYPSGEVTYLGEYMYDVCFSPDGKYVAYSSVDYDNRVDMVPEEYEWLKKTCPPGIYVREIETGKTAYIYWNPAENPEEDFMEYRHFMWIEKEGFEEFMDGVTTEETEFCSISDFEDFHYYLFCNTNIGTAQDVVNAFIGSDAETSNAGIELYQKFMEPLRANVQEENLELEYISLDCQFAITWEEVNGWTNIWRFFDGKEEKEQREAGVCDNASFRIIKSGDAYMIIDGEMFDEKADRLYEQTGYRCVKFNEQGNLAAGTERVKDTELNNTDTWAMSICDLESVEVLLTFYQGNKLGYVWQIQGDKEGGKVVYQLSNHFYEYIYPSGEIKYLGKDMYYLCYSPDGKYIAYSSPDYEAFYDLDLDEAKEVSKILPGIYILEVETGKTAYIEQYVEDADDIGFFTRTFQWVEKEQAEEYFHELQDVEVTEHIPNGLSL